MSSMVELWEETNSYSNVSVHLQFLMSDLTHHPSCENEEKDCIVKLAALVTPLFFLVQYYISQADAYFGNVHRILHWSELESSCVFVCAVYVFQDSLFPYEPTGRLFCNEPFRLVMGREKEAFFGSGG
jgi:hypothetical protein